MREGVSPSPATNENCANRPCYGFAASSTRYVARSAGWMERTSRPRAFASRNACAACSSWGADRLIRSTAMWNQRSALGYGNEFVPSLVKAQEKLTGAKLVP